MEFLKKNITLIVGILIPIAMIIFVACSIYLPGLFVQPKYSFLYVTGDSYNYYSKYQYFVQDGKLMRKEIQTTNNTSYLQQKDVKLNFYDVVKDESREISFEEAQYFSLDSSIVSPDGFEVAYGSRSNGIFPFFFYSSTDYATRYLKGHNISKKLNIQLGSDSYYNNFRFIGWVK